MNARRDLVTFGSPLLVAILIGAGAVLPPAPVAAAPAPSPTTAPSLPPPTRVPTLSPSPLPSAAPDSGSLDAEALAKVRELNGRLLAEPRNADLYNDLGVVYAKAGQWVQARDAFIAAVQANPVDGTFHRNLAQVLVELGETDMAVGEFQAYQQRDLDGGADAYRLIGEAYRRGERPDEAAAAFEEGLQKVADRTEKLRLALSLARLRQEQGQEQAAREALAGQVTVAREVLKEAGAGAPGAVDAGGEISQAGADSLLAAAPEQDPQAAARLARGLMDRLLTMYVDDGRVLADSDLPAEAAALYRKGWELEPERADLLLPLIVGQLMLAGQAEEARALVDQARQRQPEAKGTWLADGLLAENEGRLEAAIASYKRAKQIDPGDRDIDLKLGSVYIQTGDAAMAADYLKLGLESPNATPDFIYNYGVSLLREKKYEDAAGVFQKVVDRAPDMSAAWQALATSLKMQEKYQEAVPAYRKAIELSPAPDAKLHFNLAYCLGRSDDLPGAIDEYGKAIELEPGFQEAYYNLSRTQIQAERYADALKTLDAALKVEPDSYRILFNQGVALYHLERYQDAIDKYNQALEHKETADVLNNLGLAYDKLGNKKEAQAYYRAARQMTGSGQ